MRNKKKKLVVGITAPGSVGLLEGQLLYFKELSFETYLMSPKDERSTIYCEKEGCTLLEIKIEREISILNDVKSLVNIIKIIWNESPDVVNFGTPKIALLGLLASKLCGVKRRIYTCRGLRYEHEAGVKRWILKRMEWITGACAQTIICISPSVKALGIKDKLFIEKKCVVINKGSSNGIDIDRFNRNKVSIVESRKLRSQLQLENQFIYGFVGRLIDRKGVTELYNAFCRIYEKDKNTRLLVVGLFDFNQIADKSLAVKMQNHKGIIMPGRTDDVPVFLSIMDVFVLPAWWEGFGNVLVQAAAMGIPVIGTIGTGTCDAVSNEYNGILVDVKDDVQLEKAMEELRDDSNKRTLLGNNGIEWAKNFDSKIIWDGMHQLYLSESK